MAKTAVFFRLVTTLVIAVLLMGVYGYIFPKKSNISFWDKQSLSLYTEQALQQGMYADRLRHQISETLSQLVGEQSVHTNISVQLDLVEATSFEKKTETTVHSVGQDIYTISAVVLLDSPRDKNQIFHPLSKTQLNHYTEIVKTIIGYDEARGDKVLVLNQPLIHSWKKDIFPLAHVAFGAFICILLSILLILSIASFWTKESTYSPKISLMTRVKDLCLKSPGQTTDLFKRWIHSGKLEQVCIISLAVGTETTKFLFRYLKRAEIYQIVRRIRCLGKIPPKVIYQTFYEFIREWNRPNYLVGSDREAQDLLHEIPNGQDIYTEILASGSYQTLWDKFNAMETDSLIRFLKTEAPEIIAFILFHLSDNISGKILCQLPDIMRSRVLVHLKHIRSVGGAGRSRLMGKIARDFYQFNQTKTTGMKKVSAILNTLSEQERQQFDSSQTISKIQNWQDVLGLSQKQKIRLLTYLDLGVLATALSDRGLEEQNLFAQILSAEQWRLVAEQMSNTQNSEQARKIITKTAQELFG